VWIDKGVVGWPRVSQHKQRVVIATAGHVDHGKAALMRALTGSDTDRLPDEKRRGISIELGFAELPGTGISFIDVPGHRKLVHAMVAGVGGVDAVLLVVAADDGVMPQTLEHLHICSLLGIDHVIVALSKCDLVDNEMLELAASDVQDALAALGLPLTRMVHTSAETSQGIEELEGALVELAAALPRHQASARLWLPIDRVFSVRGAGTVVTGTLTRGRILAGEELFVAGERGVTASAVRALEIHGSPVEQASAPTRVAVNLARVDAKDVRRGDVVTADSALCRSDSLDISLRALPGCERDLGDRSPVQVYIGTARTGGRVTALGEGLAHLALDHPLPCEGGVGVVLRGFRATREHGAVLGGGRVLDAAAPRPPRRNKARARELRARTLEAVQSGALGEALTGLMQITAPRPIDAADVERRLGLAPGRVTRTLGGTANKSGAVALDGGALWTTAGALDGLVGVLLARVQSFHESQPHESGQSLETLRAELARHAGREVAELCLRRAVGSGRLLELDGGLGCLPGFAERSAPVAQKSAAQLYEAIDGAGLQGVSETALVATNGEPPEATRAALGRLAKSGSARRLAGLWFSERHLEALRDRLSAYFETQATLGVPAFKELAGVSRKQAIPLLEQLDREGTTRRQGDERVLGASARRRQQKSTH